LAVGLLAASRRRKGGGGAAGRPYLRGRRVVDVEKIASEDRLRDEDIDVIKALAESGGEALESEVRGRLNLPKDNALARSKAT